MRNERRVCQHKIKVVVKFLRDELWVIEVVLKVIWVVFGEFGIVLSEWVGYIEEEDGFLVFGVVDGVVDAGGGEEAAALCLDGLVG